MKKAIAVVFASVVVGSMIGLASGLSRKPAEPRMLTEGRQSETTASVREDPAAVVPPLRQDDLATATTMQRFRETRHVITSAAIAYHTIMNCNSVAMQFAMMRGGGRRGANRIPPGIQESLNALPLDSLPDEVNRVKDDPLIPPEERQTFAELWTLYCDLKLIVDNPGTYSYSKYDELRRRFEHIVQNKPATMGDSAENRVARVPDTPATGQFSQIARDRIAAAQERLAMVEKNIQNESRRVQNDLNQKMTLVEQKQLVFNLEIDKVRFEQSLGDLIPQTKGEALVWRSRKLLIDAKDAFRNGYIQYGERLLWDAADSATRASNIDQTRRIGEFAVKQVIEARQALSRSDLP